MSIIVLSFATSERSTRLREGLSGGVSIPRMINPLLEGFDPARRPLLFSCGILACCAFKFWPVAPLRDGSGSIVQIWQLRDRQFARTLLNRRKPLRQLPSAGDSAWSIMILLRQRLFLVSAVLRGAAAPFAATARFATVGNWTAPSL